MATRSQCWYSGLKIDEFEYAFQLDGPYDESRGLLFDKNNVLLDPFAKAVTGQRNWGERPESDEGFVYHARVVENNFDWGKMTFPEIPAEDLIIIRDTCKRIYQGRFLPG